MNSPLERTQVGLNVPALAVQRHDLFGWQWHRNKEIQPLFGFPSAYTGSDQPPLQGCLRRPRCHLRLVPPTGLPPYRIITRSGDGATEQFPGSPFGEPHDHSAFPLSGLPGDREYSKVTVRDDYCMGRELIECSSCQALLTDRLFS